MEDERRRREAEEAARQRDKDAELDRLRKENEALKRGGHGDGPCCPTEEIL